MLKQMLKLIQLKLKLQKNKIRQCPKHLAPRSSSSPTLSTSDWANLPDDILDEIMKKVCSVYLLTFGGVCKSWRLIYINRISCLPRNIPIGVPILLLNSCKPNSNSRKFVKMSGERASDEIFMPEAANKWVCGSSYGWLVLEGTTGREVSLLNPLTRRVIHLPSVDTFILRLICQDKLDDPLDGVSYIHKAILSTNPAISKQDCIIMAIVGCMRRLSYCRIRDKKWTNIECSLSEVSDVIYYEGKFYAIDVSGVLMSCDIIDPSSMKIIATGSPYRGCCPGRNLLVMASGHLLLVTRLIEKYSFDVHSLKKCNPSCDQLPPYTYLAIPNKVETRYRWVKIDSIGDQMLFVGNNSSFSLPIQKYGGRANCIYFTDCHLHLYLQDNYIGMYNIAKKSILLYIGNTQNELLPSFWVTPTPW